MDFDYGDKRFNEYLNHNEIALPAYGERAREIIKQTLGYMPSFKDYSYASNEAHVRLLLKGMDDTGNYDRKFLEDCIKRVFRPIHESEYNENVRTHQ